MHLFSSDYVEEMMDVDEKIQEVRAKQAAKARDFERLERQARALGINGYPKLCGGTDCTNLIGCSSDWYEVIAHHDNRIAAGPYAYCSLKCMVGSSE